VAWNIASYVLLVIAFLGSSIIVLMRVGTFRHLEANRYKVVLLFLLLMLLFFIYYTIDLINSLSG
jgi:uncharacterized membrane protein YsdA (DUF1294 family)